MQKELCRSATREARSRMDERFVTVCIVRRRVTCRTHVTSVARATLHGWPFSGDDTPGTDTLSSAFLLPTFLWQGQRKVGAAPHRGNTNKPEAKQGKAPNKKPTKDSKQQNRTKAPRKRRTQLHHHSPTRNTRVTGRANPLPPMLTSSPVTDRCKGAFPNCGTLRLLSFCVMADCTSFICEVQPTFGT